MLPLPGSVGLYVILSLSFSLKTADTVWRNAELPLENKVREPLAHGPYFPIRGLKVLAPSRMTKKSSAPFSVRTSIVIASRKLPAAWIFQMQELSVEPSGNIGVDNTPGTWASMTMLVFDGEQAGTWTHEPKLRFQNSPEIIVRLYDY